MEISKTIKFVGPFDQKLIKKLFPIFLILNVLLLPLKIFFFSSFLTQIISALIDGIIFILIIEALKKIYNNENYLRPRFSNIKITLQKLLRIFIASILPIIFTLLGLVCFIVPGFICAKRYMYVQVISEEELIGPLNAMKKSKLISKNQRWDIFSSIFWLSVGYGIIGLLMISIGSFFGTFISEFINSALSISINPLGTISWIASITLGWVATVHISSLLIKGYQEGKLSINKN
tara:strand:- start:33 stop:734 length:702 start_codon:yes stop_codon:yes gene_type:complete